MKVKKLSLLIITKIISIITRLAIITAILLVGCNKKLDKKDFEFEQPYNDTSLLIALKQLDSLIGVECEIERYIIFRDTVFVTIFKYGKTRE